MRFQLEFFSEDVSQLKEFVDWMLHIGNGIVGEICDEVTIIDTPSNMLIENLGDLMYVIVNNT